MTDEPSILDRDQIFMHMALGVAKEAYRAGEVPVGAVLVKESEVCRHLLQQFFQQLREAQPVPS